MKIEMLDHQTMEIEAESVSDHFFLCQFDDAVVRLKLPRPFAHNSCKLEMKIRPEPEEAIKVEEPKQETPVQEKP